MKQAFYLISFCLFVMLGISMTACGDDMEVKWDEPSLVYFIGMENAEGEDLFNPETKENFVDSGGTCYNNGQEETLGYIREDDIARLEKKYDDRYYYTWIFRRSTMSERTLEFIWPDNSKSVISFERTDIGHNIYMNGEKLGPELYIHIMK